MPHQDISDNTVLGVDPVRDMMACLFLFIGFLIYLGIILRDIEGINVDSD